MNRCAWRCRGIDDLLRVGPAFLLLAGCSVALAGALTDGSAGPVRSFSGKFTVPETVGSLQGTNLFHSFKTFGINAGESATFTTSTRTIRNVISRVTGGEASGIYGLLKLQAATGSSPDFYLINPAGVVFGSGAQVDVPAGLHVSTAQQLKFADGFVLETGSPSNSSLTTSAPESFGFLGRQSAASILVHNRNAAGIAGNGTTTLLGKSGASLTLTADTVQLTNAAVVTPGGKLVVAATGSQRLDLALDGSSKGRPTGSVSLSNARLQTNASGSIAVSGGPITVGNSSRVISAEGSPTSPGRIALRSSSDITIDGSSVVGSVSRASNLGASVSVTADGQLSLLTGGEIISQTVSTKAGGDIAIAADSLTVDDTNATGILTGIFSQNSSGRAGAIDIVVKKNLDIFNGAQIRLDGTGTGAQQSISIQAGSLTIDDHARPQFFTGIFTRAGAGSSENAGGINIQVVDGLTILAAGVIASTTASTGDTGAINISAGSLTIDGAGLPYGPAEATGIVSAGLPGSSGQTGRITVNVPGEVRLINGGAITGTSYFPNASGAAGAVELVAGSLTIDGGVGASGTGTGIFSATYNARDAGHISVTVETGDLNIFGGGQILSSTFAKGSAGPVAVQVKTGSLTIDNQTFTENATGIHSNAEQGSSGNAGQLKLAVNDVLSVLRGGRISSSTFSSGAAGTVDVQAGSILLDQGAGIVTQTFSEGPPAGRLGNAGTVRVNVADSLVIRGASRISSSTYTDGNGGEVAVGARTISVVGAGSMITAAAGRSSSGQSGNVAVAATDDITLSDGGSLSIRNDATVADPSIPTRTVLSVSARNITLKDGTITAESTGNVDASDIQIRFGGLLWVDPSSITTNANLGNGGHIFIGGGRLVRLDGSQITTSVLGASGNGGDITIQAGALVLNNGFIQANTAAAGAGGGDVNISVNALLASGNSLTIGGSEPAVFRPGLNVIQAAAPAGVSGSVNTTLPSLDIAGKLARLNAEVIDPGRLARDPCRVATRSSFTPVGRGGLRPIAAGLIRPERVDPPSAQMQAQVREEAIRAARQLAQVNEPSDCRD